MNERFAAVSFLAFFLALNACADSNDGLDRLLSLSMQDLMAVKVKISTNTEQSLSKAPSVVTVITADDIRKTGATNLTDILQSVPGIYVRANLFGFRPQVTFRGASGTHTLLMLNGEPVRDLVWSSGIFWKGLPTNMIERVEIIRGPGSALFGSDASAGVINVITKTAGKIERSEAGVRAGSFDSQAGWVQHGGRWNGIDIGFTAELSHTDGHDPFIAVDGQTAKDTTYHTHVSYAPGNAHYGWDGQDLHLSLARDSWRMLADYLGHSHLQTGLTGAGVLDPLTSGSDYRYDLALFYDNRQVSTDWGLNAELRYNQLHYSSGDGFQERPPGYTDDSGTYIDGVINKQRSSERGLRFEASGLYSGIKRHAIRLGGGYNREDLYSVEQFTSLPDGELVDISATAEAFAPEKAREIGYLFLQDIWTLSYDWELTAGARYDHYSDFGGTLNPRLALVWQSTDRLTSKLMYGEAFRAPSYLELYSHTAANIPNPDLTPERSRTWDLLFSYLASRDLDLGLDLYRFAQSNLIAPDDNNQFQNMGDRTAYGVELEAQWHATRTLSLSGNLTRIDERHSQFNNLSLPKETAYLRADWAFAPRWNWDVQANWIGKRKLPAGNPRAPLHAYTLVDTTLRYSPRSNWEFAASIRNLFNADAREYSSSALPDNLPLPGRSGYAEMRYRF